MAASETIDRYLEDSSGFHGEAKQVFLPATVEKVRELVGECSRTRTPLTLAGAGTGLTGARVPQGGAVLSLERFNEIEIEGGRARCGTGALLRDVQKAAARVNQFFGPNPTEDSASIGGIISTNAGGARSFHYGSVRRHVLAVEVTFMDGRTIWLERGQAVDFPVRPVPMPATTKNSAGYYLPPHVEWVDLLAGSEGTLGIITRAELQLLPAPAALLAGVIFFSSDFAALEAVESWRGVSELRLLEFLDGRALDFVRPQYPDVPPDAQAALMIEQNLESEEDAEIDRWAQRLEEQNAFGETSWFGFRGVDHERFREFRHTLATNVTDTIRRRGFPKCSTDFAVPFQYHRELYARYKQRCEEVFSGRYTIFGHAGDANNHINLLPVSKEQALRGEELMYEFAEFVVSLGGTVAAEHGIGKTKKDLLKLMYSPADIEAMKEVKRRLDPQWLLGQNTIFDVAPLFGVFPS
ncbi:MAG TPA: FAD-binding oxidoreductase [Bryobacteraceae bacterium]